MSLKAKLVKVLVGIMLSSVSSWAYCELKELNDKKLEDLTGKEGITVDIESQLKIGEVYWGLNAEPKNRARKNYLPQKPAPITYDIRAPKR